MNIKQYAKWLKANDACGEAITWSEERPDFADWWSGIKYSTKEKAEQIEQAVEDHWIRFKKKYGRV